LRALAHDGVLPKFGEDGVEGGREFGVAVPDQEAEPAASVVEVHEQVAGLLGEPSSGGAPVAPGVWNRTTRG
jgi:hypothetical protein